MRTLPRITARACLVVALVSASACSIGNHAPRLNELYDQAASHHDETRNPVIVIPGILGSKLMDTETNRIVWGAFSGDYADPRKADGARLVALPMEEGLSLRDLRDSVAPNGVLDRVKVSVAGLPIELNAYREILVSLGVGGYRDELLGKAGAIDYGDNHFTCFQFDYDWRRDIVENARRLHVFIMERHAYVQRELNKRYGHSGERDIKFDIVAHSMGGLLARYYLQYGPSDLPADGSLPAPNWIGAQKVHRVVLVGTPNAGSVKAFLQLVRGATLAPGLPTYSPAVIGTMPSVYQLLPRSRHRPLVRSDDPKIAIEDILDPVLWEQMEWGLADPAEDRNLRFLLPDVRNPADRRRIALDHQRKCLQRTRLFHEALDVTVKYPPDLELYLISGDAEPTDAAVAVDVKSGEVKRLAKAPGDGTVLRSSALMDERLGREWTPRLASPIPWRHVTFLFRDHLGLTKDPTFTDNILFLLLEKG